MPVWHKATRKYVKAGKVVVIGLIQEQHPDRCRLFAQWQHFEFPILHDPINFRPVRGIPIITVIDEYGIVRKTPKPSRVGPDFIDKTFPAPDNPQSATPLRRSSITGLMTRAHIDPSAENWRALADAIVIWQPVAQIDTAIDAYQKAVALDDNNAPAHFGLGVAYRMRYDSPRRHVDDFQNAVNAWTAALQRDPNNYIFRRRIQQYGPRLQKPYSFYDWIARARRDIIESGKTPVPLVAEPTGAELAHPAKMFKAEAARQKQGDPAGKITRDTKPLIHIESAVAPNPVKISRNAAVSVHLVFRPNAEIKAHWNNEAEPLRLWIMPPQGWAADHPFLKSPNPDQATSHETRQFAFELKPPADVKAGPYRIPAYVLYNVCEDVTGTCLFRRQDVSIQINLTD